MHPRGASESFGRPYRDRIAGHNLTLTQFLLWSKCGVQQFAYCLNDSNALRWTRLSCHAFRHNAVRLELHALAYNLANFLRTLALPADVEHWSLTTMREKLVKIGARIVRHGRYVVFQLAEVAVPRALFEEILRRIDRLKPRPLLT